MKSIFFIYISLFILSCTSNSDRTLSVLDLEAQLNSLSSMQDETERLQRINVLWDSLTTNYLIPFTQDSLVLFLYRGEAESVHWNGDFTGWGGNQGFRNDGIRIEGTDIWMLKQTLPSDARIDYKVTLNEQEWILDPANPFQQWSGFGPNSELRMPDWKPEVLTKRIPEAKTGTFSDHKIIDSKELGYPVSYRVYTPPGYENLGELPAIYTTDGQEYGDDRLGAAIPVLDNLIHLNKISPVIAIFVSPLNPDDGNENRRHMELGTNEAYLSFFVDELIPEIEKNYTIDGSKEARAILGTSLGGLNATYFGFAKPGIFGKIAIQAPAFWYREEIYDIVRSSEVGSPDIFMSVGTISDNTEVTREMKKIFEEKSLEFSYLEVSEGHSWGAWGAQMDDILIQFFGI